MKKKFLNNIRNLWKKSRYISTVFHLYSFLLFWMLMWVVILCWQFFMEHRRNRRTKNKERTFQLNPTCLYVTLMSQPLTVIIFLCVQASWCLHSVHCPRNARGLFVCVCMWNFLTTSRIRIKWDKRDSLLVEMSRVHTLITWLILWSLVHFLNQFT